jgi:AcrR family transcriptional regulator
MAKTDRRIQRTRRMLREALVDLIPEKGFDAIKIRDVTERADIAYATFFRHYDSLEELLGEQVELVIRDLEASARGSDGDRREAEGVLVFRHVEANQKLFGSLLGKNSSRAVVSRLKEVMIEIVRPYALAHYEQVKSPLIPMEVVLNHVAAAIWELVTWWVTHDMPYPADRMAQIYDELVIEATWWAVSGGRSLEHAPSDRS